MYRYRLLLLFCLAGCRQSPPDVKIYQQSQLLMGTVVQIKAASADGQLANLAIQAAFDEIKRVDGEFDHRQPDSLVSKVNQAAGCGDTAVSAGFARLVNESRYFSVLTGGGFDITVGPLSALWKFDAASQFVPESSQIKSAMEKVDYRKLMLHLDPPVVELVEAGMQLDFGAIAQGYAADRAFKAMADLGIKSMIVDASGELRVSGNRPDGKPWVIGIQHPRQPDKLIATIEMNKGAVATSGDYERFFMYQGRRYHHILDPRTGYPAAQCQSVSVWAPSAAAADALATGIFVMGPDVGMKLLEKLPEVEGLIITADGKKLVSSGLNRRLKFVP